MLIYFNTEGINLYFLCPFISFFFLVGASFVAGQSTFGKYAYTQNIIISFGEMLAIIPYLISEKIDEDTYKDSSKRNSLNKEEKISNSKKSLSLQLEYNNIEEELSHVKFYQILLLGFVDFLQSFSIFYGNELYSNNFQIYFWTIYILFICIFKKILLKNRLYRHQIVSLAIFAVLDIVYTCLILTDPKIEFNHKQLIFIVLSGCCFSFEIIFEKRLIETTFISIYKLCFLLGLATFCYNLILSLITTIVAKCLHKDSKIRKHFFDYSDYFNDIDNFVNEIFFTFLFIIFNGIYNILQFVTIKFLSPYHTLITQLILALYMTVINKLTGEEISLHTFIFAVVFHIICFLVLFIFIEILQLNFCGISKDTKLRIGLRSDDDKYFEALSTGSFDENQNGENIRNKNKNNMNKMEERTGSECSEGDYSF